MATTKTTLDVPELLEPSTANAVSTYMRDGAVVAFSLSIGNDTYYFADSDEFGRIKGDDYTVNDFKLLDLCYSYDYDISDVVADNALAVEFVDRNVRVPSGYMIVRPWYPSGGYNYWDMIATWPGDKAEW